VIGKVIGAYATLYGQVETGTLRGRRKSIATAKPLRFRKGAAQAYDDRCLSWDYEGRQVSIWTVAGRPSSRRSRARALDW
jgi:hypothetical protein